ncbi:MAG: TRAP transporter small permease [Spirochaetales bacterium]|jgi:TRAP-type C4-dicarboxylate transport system permease small subunit
MQTIIFKIIAKTERVLTAIAAALMAVLSIVVCWQVFARYILQKSPIWVEEFSVTAIMWVGLLGAAAAVWTGDHMRLEILTKKVPKRFGVVVEILIDVAIGYFALFLFTNGLILTEATWTSQMSTIALPIGLTYLVLPIAAALMMLFAFFRIVAKILEASKKNTVKAEPNHAR